MIMLIKAIQKTTRQTPRKLSLVARVVRHESLTNAIKQLSVIERRSSQVILKVIRQAIANAMHNHGAKFDQLSLKEIIINEGPRYRRFRAVSRGRAHNIIKRTSHVKVVLEMKETNKSLKQETTPLTKGKVSAQKTVSQKKSKLSPSQSPVSKKRSQMVRKKIDRRTKLVSAQSKQNIASKVIKKQKKA